MNLAANSSPVALHTTRRTTANCPLKSTVHQSFIYTPLFYTDCSFICSCTYKCARKVVLVPRFVTVECAPTDVPPAADRFSRRRANFVPAKFVTGRGVSPNPLLSFVRHFGPRDGNERSLLRRRRERAGSWTQSGVLIIASTSRGTSCVRLSESFNNRSPRQTVANRRPVSRRDGPTPTAARRQPYGTPSAPFRPSPLPTSECFCPRPANKAASRRPRSAIKTGHRWAATRAPLVEQTVDGRRPTQRFLLAKNQTYCAASRRSVHKTTANKTNGRFSNDGHGPTTARRGSLLRRDQQTIRNPCALLSPLVVDAPFRCGQRAPSC